MPVFTYSYNIHIFLDICLGSRNACAGTNAQSGSAGIFFADRLVREVMVKFKKNQELYKLTRRLVHRA